MNPAAPLAPDKQRRLCLATEHLECSTYRAATAELAGDDGLTARRDARRPLRSYARTAPLILDHGRMTLSWSMPMLGPDRGVGQLGLVALLAIALVAVVFARLPGVGATPASDGGAPGGTFIAAPSATATPASSPTGDPATSEAPVRTLVPTEVEPTPAPSEAAEATPEPERSPATYKVRRGDTLSGIAAEFETTWQVLAEINGIDDPGRLRVGQILVLP